ncbi:MAG: D-2-hydroxyacid dehydrogenase [Thermomicrobiales bacterium]
MKVVLTKTEGYKHFGLLDDLEIPGLELVKTTTPAEVAAEIGDAEVFYGFPTADVLRQGKALKWIQSPSAGVNFLQHMPELVQSDILLTNTRGAHGPSIGEHTFALLFALTRHLDRCLQGQRERRWAWSDIYYTSHEIYQRTMGIIGYGAIGRSIAQRARGFEMNVIAVDAHPAPDAPFVDEVWGMDRLPDLLRQSDVVAISAPLTDASHHLLGAQELALMKPNAYLIVVSRGGIVEESALAEALTAGTIAGAGIDVAEVEPLSADSPLWDAPNLIISPHTAGDSSEKEQRCVQILRENLIRYAAGEPLVNVVDKARGY